MFSMLAFEISIREGGKESRGEQGRSGEWGVGKEEGRDGGRKE